MSTPFQDIRSLYALPTTDQTVVNLELAGLGNRLMAALIDLAILGLLMAGSFVLAFQIRPFSAEISTSLSYLLPFCVSFGGSFLQEWLWKGRSVGKAMLCIRVVRVNGQPIGVWEALGRNLFRMIDVWMLGVGLLAIMFTPHERRFGDFLAGTIVINDRVVTLPSTEPVSSAGAAGGIRAPSPALPSLQEAGRRLTPEEGSLVADFLVRRAQLRDESANALAQEIQDYLTQRLHAPIPDAVDGFSARAALENLYWGFRQAQREQQRGF
ncbi:MAG: RDD family protein [Vampirovibrionales bacterium]|nr:RDD family protein [Vampirovibrionales bacterium]